MTIFQRIMVPSARNTGLEQGRSAQSSFPRKRKSTPALRRPPLDPRVRGVSEECNSNGICLAAVEGRHYLAGEPAQLLAELGGRQAFGPMDHEIFEAWIFRLDRLDPGDDLGGRAAEPGLLLHPLAQGRYARRGARRAPGAALLVGVAHEAERGEPLVAFVVRRLGPANGLLLGVGQIDPSAPAHVLAELHLAPVLVAGVVEGAHHVVEDFLAVQRDHRLEALARHQVDRAAAGDRHPKLDRQVLRPRHAGDLFELIAAIGTRGGQVKYLPSKRNDSSLKHLSRSSSSSSKMARLASASSSGAPKVSTSRVW